MRAHAIYKYPHCLFKGKHAGRKVFAMYCHIVYPGSRPAGSLRLLLVHGDSKF